MVCTSLDSIFFTNFPGHRKFCVHHIMEQSSQIYCSRTGCLHPRNQTSVFSQYYPQGNGCIEKIYNFLKTPI